MSHICYKDIASKLDINPNGTLLISSDITALAKNAIEHGEFFDPNIFIDSFIEQIGENGTLLFPTYNWDFCKGKTFDYNKTPCMTGVLGKVALKRNDFIRTRHPIYSFAVWGKDKDYLYSLANKDSFGIDSPFAYLYDSKAQNLMINSDLKDSLTFVHYVEEQSGGVEYRFNKDFTSGYIDEKGAEDIRTYSMFVRNLDLDVVNTINPLEELFARSNVIKFSIINNILFRMLDLNGSYNIILNDILHNKSKSICTYKGQ